MERYQDARRATGAEGGVMTDTAWALTAVALVLLALEWLDGRVRLEHMPRPHAWRWDGGYRESK